MLGMILAILVPCTIPMIKHMIIPGLWIMGGTFVFMLFMFSGMRYLISGDKLYMKTWFISMGSANISDIISVERSYNWMAKSPAASAKRLHIGFRKGVNYSNMFTWQVGGNWLISPVREQEFIEELKAVNPDIYVRVPDKKGIWRVMDWDI